MKTFPFRSWLLLFLALCVASGCVDHVSLQPLRYRLKTVSYTQGGDPASFTLTYAASGELQAYTKGSLTEPFSVDNGTISYGQSRSFNLTQLAGTYNAAGFPGSYDLIFYGSGSTAQLLGTYAYVYAGNSSVPSLKRFTSGGSTTEETYVFTNGNATQINGRSFSYDDKPNPYKGLFRFNSQSYLSRDYPFGGGTAGLVPFDPGTRYTNTSVKAFNQNNITTEAQLTYNSDGLVTRIAYTSGQIEQFTYEAY